MGLLSSYFCSSLPLLLTRTASPHLVATREPLDCLPIPLPTPSLIPRRPSSPPGPLSLSHSVNEPRGIEAHERVLQRRRRRRPLNYANSSFTRAINYSKRERERESLADGCVCSSLSSKVSFSLSPSLSLFLSSEGERKKRCNYGQSSLMKERAKKGRKAPNSAYSPLSLSLSHSHSLPPPSLSLPLLRYSFVNCPFPLVSSESCRREGGRGTSPSLSHSAPLLGV